MPDISASTSARTPRIYAYVNGATLNSIMSAEIMDAGSCKSSHFELTASIIGGRSDDQWLDSVDGKVVVQIFMHLPAIDRHVAMLEGLADNFSIDPINRTARISGRDYSSVLVNSSYQASFCNQTASEIASFIASRHGFESNVVATSTLIGSYQYDTYNQILLNSHSRITSEWELLKQLAAIEGFEMFVEGTTLVFAPSESLSSDNISVDPKKVTGMRFYRNCQLSSETIITAKSWNTWLGQTLSTDEKSVAVTGSHITDLNADSGNEIAIARPNLNQQGVEQLAKRHLDALKEQEFAVQITMPGDLSLRPRDILTVSGGGSTFDADYIVKTVRRRFSTTTGFTQYIHGFANQAAPPSSTAVGSPPNG